jgi:hypothetical protein
VAETLDRGEDLVGGFDPLVWGGIFIVGLDEGVDVSFRASELQSFRASDTSAQTGSWRLKL